MTKKEDISLVDVARDYWDWIQLIIAAQDLSPRDQAAFSYSYYGSDSERTERHDILCKILGLDKETTKKITDNLVYYNCFEDFYEALCQLKKGG